jgi:hypothetical protein
VTFVIGVIVGSAVTTLLFGAGMLVATLRGIDDQRDVF